MTSQETLTSLAVALDSKIVISTRTDNDGVSGRLTGSGGIFAVAQDGLPQNGTVVINGNGIFSYVPVVGWTGEDSFTFIVTDAQGLATSATVRISVAVDAPRATEGTDGGDILIGGYFTGSIFGGAGADVLEGGLFYDSLYGGDGDDHLLARDSGDTLYGGNGNDTLENVGGNGSTLFGGSGNDTYLLTDDGFLLASIVEAADGGNDRIVVLGNASEFYLDQHIETLDLSQSTVFIVYGSASSNTIIGNSGNNLIYGGGGTDRIYGGAGNDQLHGSDNSRLFGGAGDDTYDLRSAGASAVEAAGGGVDLILAYRDITLGAQFENGSVAQSVNLAISITGNALNNTLSGGTTWNGVSLFGGDGHDHLTSGEGTDRLEGGNGNDFLTAVFPHGPSNGDKFMFGGAGDDTLYAGRGDDRLYGGAGNDTLNGSYIGNDHIEGGVGNDTYILEQAALSINFVERVGEGKDTIIAYQNAGLSGTFIENLVLMGWSARNGSGNEFANRITGNEQDNVLNGLAGADTLIGLNGVDWLDGGRGNDRMEGGLQNDFYVVDSSKDVVVEAVNAGIDQVEASVSYTLAAQVERLILTGEAAINGTGNVLANRLTGNMASNVLNGGFGTDVLIGQGGGDRLQGGEGKDTLMGGMGDDVFRFGSIAEADGDLITDFRGVAGNDNSFRISATGFGGGLVAGATVAVSQFQSRADNLAQDADDRFIFRTTDTTLWFDSNGRAAGGLTLLADLQAGAVVTAADISLI